MSRLHSSGLLLNGLARLRQVKQAAERVEARVRFALGRRSRVAPLTEEQVQSYQRDGYLLVSSLIPEATVRAAQTAMWERLRADPSNFYTWPRLGPPPHAIKDDRLLATYTDAMLGAAAQLSGADVGGFLLPRRAFTVNRVPASGEWHVHQPHLDRSAPLYRYRTFPPPYRIGALTYLTTVPVHGGGTVVWPGSHTRVEALARSEPAKFRYLSALSDALSLVPLGPPVELTPVAGDVLFHHYLCVHASSENVSHTPRLTINHKW
jgi:hypothetical protein